VILFQDGAVIGSPWGTGSRARFIDHPTRSGSVYIEGTQREDAGLYQCVTTNPARDHQSRIQTVRLHVLEAPSPPHCAMSGEEALGGSVILTCDSSSGNPAPTYSWWKVDSYRNLMLNSSHTSQGTLVVQNLSVDSSGVYLCIASNVLGSDRCSVELILQIFEESAHGMATGIGITLTMGVIILVLFGTVLWLHSRNAAAQPGQRAAAGRNSPPPAGL
ncbi:immunoglobulin superfamily member 11-like, partial [Pristis pectinata]|uniref:immunoglobulin superfamily member 11-like n=1 Tax=Pristis pectinata TaxID=685728 RepID=UPI00223E3873